MERSAVIENPHINTSHKAIVGAQVVTIPDRHTDTPNIDTDQRTSNKLYRRKVGRNLCVSNLCMI